MWDLGIDQWDLDIDQIEQYGEEIIKKENILYELEDKCIVSFKKNEDSNFIICEECDGYFSCVLTKEQLLRMANS